MSYSSWAFPQSVPMSNCQFAGSGSWPAGPSNSSCHTRRQSPRSRTGRRIASAPGETRAVDANAIARPDRLGTDIIETSRLAVSERASGRRGPPAVRSSRRPGLSSVRQDRWQRTSVPATDVIALRRPITSRSGSSSRSPTRASPPPTITIAGFSMLTMPATAIPRCSAASCTTWRATGSPASAASTIASTVSSSPASVLSGCFPDQRGGTLGRVPGCRPGWSGSHRGRRGRADPADR